jgi:isoquinoline 1-oxidoreductase beta subunit
MLVVSRRGLTLQSARLFDVVIIRSTESPNGVGEPATPLIGAAVANAYFNLNGKRVYRLPFEPT